MSECLTDEKKSTHKVEVVPLVLEKHPNADRLSVAKVWGFSCVVATDQWAGVENAAYLPPDSLVDVSRPEFAFLAKDAKADGKARIKAKKLRGVLSFGLLVPAPADAKVGDDVAAQLGVEHYDPGVQGQANNRGGLFTGGEVEKAPNVYAVKYDLEAGRRYAEQVFQPGEPVLVSEKVHGANARYVYAEGKMYCGSRTEWKKEFPSYDHVTVESLTATGKVDEERAKEIVAKLKGGTPKRNMWWEALDATPALRAFCEANPGVVVYGEVYGAVQDLNYGHQKGQVSFVAFDMLRDGKWVGPEEFFGLCDLWCVPTVPVLNPVEASVGAGEKRRFKPIPYDFDAVCEMAEGKTLFPNASHVREGVVVRPWEERYDPRLGRAALKWVGASYLERSKEVTPCETTI